MNSPRITYTPHPDAMLEAELGALTTIYRRAIERYEEKEKGGPASRPDNPERRSHEIRAESSIPRG